MPEPKWNQPSGNDKLNTLLSLIPSIQEIIRSNIAHMPLKN
jgi:hypothetical protein